MTATRVLFAAVLLTAAPASADPATDSANGPVRSLATADGRIYAVSAGMVRALDGKAHQTAQRALPAGVEAYAVAVSPDHRALAVSRTDGTVWILDPATLAVRRTVHITGKIEKLPDAQMESENPFGEVRGVGFSPAGKLITISENGALCFEAAAICYDAMPSHMGVIARGQVASFGVAGDRAVFAWRASKLVTLLPGTAPVALGHTYHLPDNGTDALAVSANGTIAMSYGTNTYDLIVAGKQLQIFSHGLVVTALALSPDAHYLAIASRAKIERVDLHCVAQLGAASLQTTTVSPAGGTAVAVTDRGVVISGDATGQISTSGADETPPKPCT